MNRQKFKTFKRIVIKVGSRILTTEEGNIDKNQIRKITKQIATLKAKKIDVILVSSGAVALGRKKIKATSKLKTVPEKQAAAAVGQNELMQIYAHYFKKHNLHTAQILLTYDDLKNRTRYLNVCNTIETLLKCNIVPIINENDTVSVDEIKFGDNDKLSALVTNLLRAETLIMLSSIDGLYGPTNQKGKKSIIKEVSAINQNIKKLIYQDTHWATTGGMESKLEAAKMVSLAGEPVIIANGRKHNVLLDIFAGKEIGTIFLPTTNKRMESKKRWIAFLSHPKGKIKIDDGAQKALLTKGKSLLPSGILKVSGSIAIGDTVSIVDINNNELARGLSNYTTAEIEKIKGLKTAEIEKALGTYNYDEVVHRDNLVLL